MNEPTVLRIPLWLARKNSLPTTEVEVEVLGSSRKAVQVRATAHLRPAERCLRCGLTLTEATSRVLGIGPECCDRIGIPRDLADASDVEAARREVRAAPVEVWLPRSQVEVLSGSLPGDAPTPRGGATVSSREGSIDVRTPYDPEVKEALKSVPGAKWDSKRKVWSYPATPAAAEALAETLDRVVGDWKADQGVLDLLDTARSAAAARAHRRADDLPDVPSSKTSAWMHQRQAFWWSREQPAAGLAMAMGTGKSKVAADLHAEWAPERTLVVCPNRVVGVWPREFGLHSAADPYVVAIDSRSGTVAQRAEKMLDAERAALAHGRPLVVVANYESVWRGDLAEAIKARDWGLVVADESHRIKSPGAKASRFLAGLRGQTGRRLCLTGTLMPHSPADVYGQARFLDPAVFGTSFARFRNRYAVMGGFEGRQILGWRIHEWVTDPASGERRENPYFEPTLADEWHERLSRLFFEVGDDVLDLPDEQHVDLEVEIPPKAMKAYKRLRDEMVAEVESGHVTVANGGVRVLRQQQVTSGYLPVDLPADENDEAPVIERVHTAKADALADLLADIPPGEPVVVFARFRHDLDEIARVAEEAGRTYGEISGRNDHPSALGDDARMAEGIDVAGVQIQAGGVGIDLTRARYGVWYSVGHSLGDFEQSVRRVNRPGQTRSVAYYHLVATGTVDADIRRGIAEGKGLVEAAMEGARH